MFFLFLVFCLAFSPETKNDINTGRWLTKNDIKMRRCNYIFLCFFAIGLRSICDRFASNKFEINKFSLYTCARHMCFQISWRFDVDSMEFSDRFWRCSFYSLTDAGSMEVPWRFHGVLTQIPTKISQNLEQKRRPYCMNDAGSMEVRWSFHGGLMMEFPCSFHLFFTLHPCQDIPGQIGVIYIKTPWNLHGTSIKPASLIQ